MNANPIAERVYARLAAHFGRIECPLHYTRPHELCIAVILSAQCTDERVNQTTPALFARFQSLEDFAEAEQAELEALIHSTGFFRNKARHIRAFCQTVLSEFHGVIPEAADVLETLPGVGRKTANVISQELFGRTSGIVVDTHVKRISRLLGLTRNTDPGRIEKDLMEQLPQELWRNWSLLLIFLGRSHCKARTPRCNSCPVRTLCPSAQTSGKGA